MLQKWYDMCHIWTLLLLVVAVLSLHTVYGRDSKFTVSLFFCSVMVFSARISLVGVKFGTKHRQYPRQVFWNFGGNITGWWNCGPQHDTKSTVWGAIWRHMHFINTWRDMHFTNALVSRHVLCSRTQTISQNNSSLVAMYSCYEIQQFISSTDSFG